MIKRLIRTLMKIFIALISLGVSLTMIIGSISLLATLNPTAGNIGIDDGGMDAAFGLNESYFVMNVTFNNDGYFPLENFTIRTQFALQNKTSNASFTIMDEILVQQDLLAKQDYILLLNASSTMFTMMNVAPDNNGTLNDPEIQPYIDNGTVTQEQVSLLSFPYLAWSYNLTISLEITSTYFLGLVLLGFRINMDLDPYTLTGLATAYPDYKTTILSGLGVI